MKKSNIKKDPVKIAVIIATIAIFILLSIKVIMLISERDNDNKYEPSLNPEIKKNDVKKARGKHKEAAYEMIRMKVMDDEERDNIFGEIPPDVKEFMEQGGN